MAELGIRILEGDQVAVCCRVLGGPRHMLQAGGRWYVMNRNPDTPGDYCGSLYPCELLARQRWPESVPFIADHWDEFRPWQERQLLGRAKQIYWQPLERSVRAWLYPTRAGLERLLELEARPDALQISGSYEIEFEPLEIRPGEIWKVVTKLLKVRSIDAVERSTAGGCVLYEDQLHTTVRIWT